MKQFILASSSSARKKILEGLGINFLIVPSNYEEDMSLKMRPRDLAIFLSRGKAQDVAKRSKNSVVLGVDSFGVFKGQLLGKPHTKLRAKEMLTMLNGKNHTFVSGFTIIDSDSGREYSDAVQSKVYLRQLSEREIDSYLSKENSLNNAAGYIIQGLGGVLVDRIKGDYFNVSGFPLSKIVVALKDFGISFL